MDVTLPKIAFLKLRSGGVVRAPITPQGWIVVDGMGIFLMNYKFWLLRVELRKNIPLNLENILKGH